MTRSCGGPSAAASNMLQSLACWLPLIAMLPSSQIQCIRVIHIGCVHIVCGRRLLTNMWNADVLLYLSATRIMRRRFLPSSFGLMDLAWGGKKIAQAAFTLRTKSETGPFVLDACADSPPPLTYDTDRGIECNEGHRSCGTDVRCDAAVCGRGSCPVLPLRDMRLGNQASYTSSTGRHGPAVGSCLPLPFGWPRLPSLGQGQSA